MKQKNSQKGGGRNIKTRIIQIAISICVIILLIASYFLIRDLLQYKDSNDSNNELIEDVFTETGVENNDEKVIDWSKLLSINEDIIGWIRIEDTNINYPILKDNENLKYLKHSYNGNYNSNGSIFTLNSNPFNDEITTVYGHNMKNGIMFSELSKYMDRDFFDEHPSFEIYTEEQNYKVTVFSCYSTEVNQEENNIESLDFESEVEYYKKSSKHTIEDIGEIKKIVKLSTCSYLNNHTTPTNQRYYIIGKLEKID